MKKVTIIMVLLAVGFCGLAADRAEAAGSVVLTITANTTLNTWEVYADISGSNAGLASFIIDVTGTGGVTVTSSALEAPSGLYELVPPYRSFGFGLLTSNGTAGIGICASQDTVSGVDALVIEDVGVVAGSRTDAMNNTITWAAPVLLASGDFTGSVGQLQVAVGDGTFNVLNVPAGGSWTGSDGCSGATSITGGSVAVPEPATMTALALGGLALLRRRRK